MRSKTTAKAIVACALGLVFLAGCQRVEEPWVNNKPQWKQERFKTNLPDAQLRHRLEYSQVDR